MAKKPVASVRTMDETQKAELYDTISEWHKAKAKAAEWTAKEMELRKAIGAKFFADATEGTNNLALDYGKVLKFTKTISRSPDKAQLNAVLFEERKKLAEDPEYKSNVMPLIDDVISYEPKVSVSEWKKLDADQQKLLADVVTEKDGAPSLSIETPKV